MSKYALVEKATGRMIQPNEVIDVKWVSSSKECLMVYGACIQIDTILGFDPITGRAGIYEMYNPDYQIVTVPSTT